MRHRTRFPVSLSRRRALGGLGGLGGLAIASAMPAGILPALAQDKTAPKAGQGAQSGAYVDLLLVLAVDASGSVNDYRFQLQRQGYAQAFRNPRVIKAIQSGMLRSIAVTMVQWTGPDLHEVVVPWTRISSTASIQALADTIQKAPRALFGGGTSISGAIDYGKTLFPKSRWKGMRRVIDISGDGYNSSGRGVQTARDEAVKTGIIINGLPILGREYDLDRHFKEDVIGGPGSFMIAAKDFETFGSAITRKLIAEIAQRPPLPRWLTRSEV